VARKPLTRNIVARMNRDTADRLDELADEWETTVSAIVREAVKEYLAKLEKEQEVERPSETAFG